MKQLFYLLFITLLAQACTPSAESPLIEITEVTLNDDPTDYSHSLSDIPCLNTGDRLTIRLSLDGNGEELNTFIIQEKEQESGQLSHITLNLPESGVTSDKNFTRPEEGIIGFENGVRQISLSVETTVLSVSQEEIILEMFLFSKAECDGGSKVLHLRTVQNPE